MRRFAEAGRLDRLCARGQLRWQQVSDLATTVAAFHDAAQPQPPDALRRTLSSAGPALENFDELPALLPSGEAHQRAVAAG
jgi:aminoglycoside phosphotransferase family enzyme